MFENQYLDISFSFVYVNVHMLYIYICMYICVHRRIISINFVYKCLAYSFFAYIQFISD